MMRLFSVQTELGEELCPKELTDIRNRGRVGGELECLNLLFPWGALH